MKQQYRFVGACLSAALLAACGNGFSSSAPTSVGPQSGMQSLGSQPASERSRSHRVKNALQTLIYLHDFTGQSGSDGAYPYGALVSVNGTLYGTTQQGGPNNAGTVYSIASGTESVLYSFTGGADGRAPQAGLVSLNGLLYGTTSGGGASNYGTVYSVTTGGTETVLQSFYNGSMGAVPMAGLISVSGKLYGTTESGGVYNNGVAFSMTTSGVETVLHSFGASGDGANPQSPLLSVGSTLYGTTTNGGQYGAGTVFAIAKATGQETVLHSFGSSGDGNSPEYGRLVDLNGTLYGTTVNGGANGEGTVFSITPSGTETVVYSFPGSSDGCSPTAGLVLYNGLLYGTTSGCGQYGAGTIFAFDATSSTLTPVWAFGGSPGGRSPQADLIVVSGTLYGTTVNGYYGCYGGCGTVFSLYSIL